MSHNTIKNSQQVVGPERNVLNNDSRNDTPRSATDDEHLVEPLH